MFTDEVIEENRRRYRKALGRVDLVAARQEIQRLYGDACWTAKNAAAGDRAHARGTGHGGDHNRAEAAGSAYDQAFADYHDRMRPAALAAAGVDPEMLGAQTTAERAADEAFEEKRRTTPPARWGTTQWPNEPDRLAAWSRYYLGLKQNPAAASPQEVCCG